MKYLWGFCCVVGLLALIAGCGGTTGLGPNEANPVAAFSATPPEGTSYPVDVSFDASASYDPDGGALTLYRWDFENDGTFDATAGSPLTSHQFLLPGTYDVKLEVTDDESKVGVIIKPYRVYPAAQLTISDTLICIGNDDTTDDTVTLDASASDPGPGLSITLYEWDFDYTGTFSADDTSVTPTKNYSYASAGNYTAAVRITTDAVPPGQGTDTATISVVRLVAEFTTPLSGAPGQPVDFDATTTIATNTTVTNYHWEFGDGGTADTTGPTTTHTYATANTYTVTLTVTDANGFTDSVSHNMLIADLAAIIWAAVSPGTPVDTAAISGNTPVTGVFDDSHSIGAITEYAWDWEWTDSGTPGPDATDFVADVTNATASTNLTHSYPTAGTYIAVLRVYNGSIYAYDTVTITVTNPPLKALAQITNGAIPDPNAQNYIGGGESPSLPYVYYVTTAAFPVTVTFDASASTGAITTYIWDFDDGGAQGNTAVVNRDYTQEGVFEVQLMVSDGAQSDIGTLILTVVQSPHTYLSHFLDKEATPGDQDASVNERSPDTNYGDNHIHIDSYSGETQHLLFQVDLTAEVASKTILEGGVILFCYRENGVNNIDDKVHCYKTTSAWDETTVTWNTGRPTYDGATDYAFGGAGYQVPDIALDNDEWPPQPMYIDITNLMTFWVTTPASNFGGYMTAGPHSVDLSFYSDGYQGNTRNPIIVGILQ